jgi:hypothetical protein
VGGWLVGKAEGGLGWGDNFYANFIFLCNSHKKGEKNAKGGKVAFYDLPRQNVTRCGIDRYFYDISSIRF